MVSVVHFVFRATALKITPLHSEPEYRLADVMSTSVSYIVCSFAA